MNSFLRRYVHIIIVSAFLLVLVLPYILSQFSIGVSFNQTGQIGDTIGGISAPIIGLLSAYLVYISFQAQIEANRLLSESRSEDLIISNINNWVSRLDQSIKEFNYNNFNGVAGINMFGQLLMGRYFRRVEEKAIKLEDIGIKNPSLLIAYNAIINDMLLILTYIKSKRLNQELYEIHLMYIKGMIDNNFISYEYISIVIREYRDIEKPISSYIGDLTKIDKVNELIEELMPKR